MTKKTAELWNNIVWTVLVLICLILTIKYACGVRSSVIEKNAPVEHIERAVELIKEAEGFRPYIYQEPSGDLAIGYGQQCNSFVGLCERALIRRNEAETALREVLPRYESIAIKFVGVSVWGHLTPDYKAVLIDMAYNLGYSINTFYEFKKCLVQGDYGRAADEIENSQYARQTKTRAVRNARIIKGGEGER